MKKLIYILCFFLAFNQAKATTYYWIGGATATSFNGQAYWTTNATSRTPVGTTGTIAIGLSDVFIFDGTNIGGTTVVTGAVSITMTTLSTTPFAQLKFINGANVSLGRTATGSSVIDLKGDGTAAPDLVIDATSMLTQGSPTYDYNVQIIVDTLATALINGKVYLSPLSTTVHTRSYITSKATGNVVFGAGSACYITDSTASGGFNASVAGGIDFKAGSSLYYYTGRSPIGSSSTLQISTFEVGSNVYFEKSNVSYVDNVTAYGASSWTNAKFLANLFIQNGSSFTCDGAPGKIDSITVDAASTFTSHTSGQTPVLGNLTVNGTFVGSGTNSLILGGTVPQTVSGSGTINVPTFVVCDNSNVTLSKTITVSTGCSIVGKIDFGTSGTLSGTATFTSRVNPVAAALVGNITAGSYAISGVVGTIAGVTGLTVTGTGIPAGTSVVGFSGTLATIYLSQPATSSDSAAALTFAGSVSRLTNSNPNGFDSTAGSVVVTGLKTFQAGTCYVINAATTHPIGINSSAPLAMNVGNLTLNAPVTTNYITNVLGTLTLNTGKLTIRPTDTLRIASGKDIAGGTFNATKYIVTDISGSNVGVLRIDSFTTPKVFPIGTSTSFLPVTLKPTDTAGFAISAFTGVTSNAMPTGTAFSAAAKTTIVDAVWTINRNRGTGNCEVALNWPANLEGAAFSTFADNQIGISRYDTTTGVTVWTPAIDSAASNIVNTAVATFSSFTSFAVGQIAVALPVQFKNFVASLHNNLANINWQMANEYGIAVYIVEKSSDGNNFTDLQSFKSLNNASALSTYNFVDQNVFSGNNYYRIKVIAENGTVKYSNILLVKNNAKLNVQIFPNPVKAGNPMTVSFNAAAASGITINIIDFTGKIVGTTRASITQGINVISIPTNSNFKTGNYIVSIVSGNNTTEPVNIPVLIK